MYIYALFRASVFEWFGVSISSIWHTLSTYDCAWSVSCSWNLLLRTLVALPVGSTTRVRYCRNCEATTGFPGRGGRACLVRWSSCYLRKKQDPAWRASINFDLEAHCMLFIPLPREYWCAKPRAAFRISVFKHSISIMSTSWILRFLLSHVFRCVIMLKLVPLHNHSNDSVQNKVCLVAWNQVIQ